MNTSKNKIDFSPHLCKNTTNKREMNTSKNKIDFSPHLCKKPNNKREMNTEKRKYIKSGFYTRDAILKRKMERVFDRGKKLYSEAGDRWKQKLMNLEKAIDEVKKESAIKKGKYIKTGKYIKSGKYTKDALLERRMAKIFVKFDKITKEPKSEKDWYENMKKSIMNLFFKPSVEFKLEKKALNVTKRYIIDLKETGLNLMDPFNVLKEVKPLVFEKWKENPKTKQNLSIICLMEKMSSANEEVVTKEANFNSKYVEIFEGDDFQEIFKKMTDEIVKGFEEFIENGSMWVFIEGLKVVLNINKIKKLGASSWIPTSKELDKKKAIINPENYNHKCFLWCVGISELLKEDPNLKDARRITNKLKRKVENYNIDGMHFPCGFNDITKFERNNNCNEINVFGYEENEITHLRIPKTKEDENRINLLLIGNEYGNKHYCLIKNMSKLFSKQVNKHKGKLEICFYCSQHFYNEKDLKTHMEYCKKHNPVKSVFPTRELN